MVKFSTDVDLLKWEPILFRELAFSSQVLCRGDDGVVSGTSFTSVNGTFIDAGVAAGHVIYLSDNNAGIDSVYEVVSVDSATELTISVVRPTADDTAVAPPAGNNINYRITTFDPQAEEVAYSLLQYFGIDANNTGDGISAEDILDNRALRQASVFAILSAVFASSATGRDDTGGFWQKSLRYQRLFHTARVEVRLGIDVDGDDEAEQICTGGTVRLRRG